MKYFVLNVHREPVQVFNQGDWAWWMNLHPRERLVARTDFGDRYRLSTVFQGTSEKLFDTSIFVWFQPEPVQSFFNETWEESDACHHENEYRVYLRFVVEMEHGGYPMKEWPF